MKAEQRNQQRNEQAAREHAFDFCLGLDPTTAFRTVARRIWEIAESDEGVGKRFAAIQEMIGSGKPLLGGEHTAFYERLKDHRTALDLPTAPEMFRPLFVGAYLRAKQVLANGGGRGIFGDLEKRLEQVEKLAEHLEPEFAGELLAQLTLLARDNPDFAQQMRQGAAELRALAEELYGPQLSARPGAIARATGASGGGSCTCCTTIDGQTHCEPCSCWIIVIIIVIIVVSK